MVFVHRLPTAGPADAKQGMGVKPVDGACGKAENPRLEVLPRPLAAPSGCHGAQELPNLQFFPRDVRNLGFYGKHPHFYSWQLIQGFLCVFFKHGDT